MGSIEVLANGRLCTEASLVAPGTLDAEGNARIHIGGPAQPGECSLAGALITFINGSGQTLFEKRTLIPGVTQPLENLAPEAAPNTGPVPGAPAAGSGSSLAPAATGGGQRMAALGVAALAAFALVAMQLARRRRRTR
ncbi:MAG: hypothetical protein HYX53_16155 [Chloroflexi bacterium]|nr:hypothetical protein [Chloroflexota bacterium]